MKILGIDYGKKKMGLALATSLIAEPYRVIRFSSNKGVIEEVREIIKKEQIEKVVVGFSEGKMAEESRNFGKELERITGTPVHFQDETLTTYEAQTLSEKAGIKRKKRRQLEDAYSAALILQRYLETALPTPII
jgi:putative Holliday junction resolvase